MERLARRPTVRCAAIVASSMVGLMAALIALDAPLSAQSELRYQARLAPVPVDFITMANVTGSGAVTGVLSGAKLSLEGTFEGLSGPATAARIHRGAMGVRGAALFDLTVTNATAGTIKGTFELKPNHVEDFRQGRLYVQVHSEKAPDGNLWGWLLRQER
jgi:CHRD domain